jgi:hypothetical protein
MTVGWRLPPAGGCNPQGRCRTDCLYASNEPQPAGDKLHAMPIGAAWDRHAGEIIDGFGERFAGFGVEMVCPLVEDQNRRLHFYAMVVLIGGFGLASLHNC